MNVVFTLDCRVASYRAFSDTEIVVSVAKLDEQLGLLLAGDDDLVWLDTDAWPSHVAARLGRRHRPLNIPSRDLDAC